MITKKILQKRVAHLNKITGSPTEYGEAGNFSLDIANGGYILVRCCNGGGETNVLQHERSKPKEMYNLINAFITGIELK